MGDGGDGACFGLYQEAKSEGQDDDFGTHRNQVQHAFAAAYCNCRKKAYAAADKT